MSQDTQTAATISYAERWSNLRGGPVKPLELEEAYARHESGQLYVAVISNTQRALAYLEVRLEAGFVGAHFLDERLREVLAYLFVRDPQSDEGLFLQQAIRSEYRDGTDELARTERYLFRKEGVVRIEDRTFADRMIDSRDVESDVSGNWEPVPEFGRYESITRVER